MLYVYYVILNICSSHTRHYTYTPN